MEVSLPCTICGVSAARLCATCRSAVYCSIECQQTDWRTHKLLCRQFKDLSASNFAGRPSPQHHLAIYFPMVTSSPRIVWVDTEEDGHQKGHFNPKLEHLLVVPGYNKYIERNLLCVRGNSFRGRKTNQDTLNIWCLDPDPVSVPNLIVNKSIHGTIPSLIGDAWGEFFWEGPLVAVLKVGSAGDPRLLTDITLTAYRDAIDYLGYYRETIGSMIDGIGMEAHLSKRILEERAGKVWGFE
jgi:hypothetical protein